VIAIRVSAVEDFTALGERWRDLERRSEGSFFQSWTWVGCLAAERFPDAVLVEATEAGRTVALALFNRVRRLVGPPMLYLGECGTTEADSPYVEQNGVLAETGRVNELTEICLRAVASSHDLVLSGVDEAVLAAARQAAGLTLVRRMQDSPFVDLAGVRRAGGDYLAGRSANTRQQIRRSDRFYQRHGPIELERAASVGSAHVMLDEMAGLHQAAWTARGQPGSFAQSFFRRFHYALIAEAVPREKIALLKISCGDTMIGILYNFVHAGCMLAYQSGFAYRDDDRAAKPGLTSHHAAIRYALAQGVDSYDFLAGEDRYKRSLADQAHRQIWIEAGPCWSPRLLMRAGVRVFRQRRQRSGVMPTVMLCDRHKGSENLQICRVFRSRVQQQIDSKIFRFLL
jgi:CelD/BcsL family acetyltransferase involved in cellulose biosynthesis